MFSLLLLSTSCDLDKFPEDSITTETAWQSISDADKFRNGMYGTFMAVNGGIYTYIPDYQTDVSMQLFLSVTEVEISTDGISHLLNMTLKILMNTIMNVSTIAIILLRILTKL